MMQSLPLPGRRETRRLDRQRTILDVAERSFFELGYAATSMSTIAAELGGSKTTLWSYFPSKEALFVAFIDSKIADFAIALDEALIPAGGVEAALGRFGNVFLTKILGCDSYALHRLISAEGARFPVIAQAFYDRGPGRVRARLARYVGEEMGAGRLRSGDPMLAARQFLALCQAGGFADRTWHRVDAPPLDPAADVAQAVDTFLHGWGAHAG